jgi:hypothetical protein
MKGDDKAKVSCSCGGANPVETPSCCAPAVREAGAPGSGSVPEAGEPSRIRPTTSEITLANRFDHFLARWGVNRMGHVVEPGLYRLGNPTSESEVFVSANYSLSFDALRSALAGRDAYILVLDTKGINVWCAAGKGTFGTEELVRRIAMTGLATTVTHRRLILPQLSAPGVSWPEVLRRSGFLVEYAPVRARDLPEYLETRKATPAMRRVEFPLRDRAVLVPVELVTALPFMLVPVVALLFLGYPLLAADVVVAVLAGTVLFPLLLPVIPTKDFSTKGLILGFLVMIPLAVLGAAGSSLFSRAGGVATLLIFPPITAYLALNFTGSTPFTSRTGVKKEIFRYVPVMAAMVVSGTVIAIIAGLLHVLGVV